MKSVTTATDVIDALRHRGFGFVGKARDGWLRLRGPLMSPESSNPSPCEVHIDPNFLDLPRIHLLETPGELSPAAPHLSPDGALCYIVKNTVVLDIYDPIGQLLACLDRAAHVLEQIMQGKMDDDLAEEFFAYWYGQPCLIDIQGGNLGRLHCVIVETKGDPLLFITDGGDRATTKLHSLGYQATEKEIITHRVKTAAHPRPIGNRWPPRTVRDILSWQSELDSNCRRKIHKIIRDGEKQKITGLLIIVESPLMTYGFLVIYNQQKSKLSYKTRSGRDHTYGLEVKPVSVMRIDDRYLAQRNIPASKTFAGKRVALVGCGTIGGYLADMLVKAGAGTLGGELTLIDFDTLFAHNIGRHRLGFPHLHVNKAIGMANELRRLAPGAEIRALPVDVKQAELGQLDLLIDSSGEEALGHWLCQNHLSRSPMLSVWIEGPGTAVRALLKADNPSACYRCLWHSTRKGSLRSIVAPLPFILAGHGCEGLYVPFPASVSIQAASLGAEMALDWVNDSQSPSLRTRVIDRTHQAATSDCDPLPDQDCPICNP